MKITLITVSYNSAATIGDTLRSVAKQTYSNIEHIVIDGRSTDDTRYIVEREGQHLARFVSESDNGIYDAMNKGISLATGEMIGFINADDFYASPEVLSKIATVFNDATIDACYGDLCYVKQDDTSAVVRYWQSSEFKPGLFPDGWCPPHPTFFARRKIYERFGNFDLSYKLAADIELMMRLLEIHRVQTLHIPEVLVKMRMGGATNRSITNIVNQNREIIRALEQHKLPASYVKLLGSKLFSRGYQFFLKPPCLTS